MGIRTAPRYVRYAILELDTANTLTWLNAGSEHKWVIPRAATTKSAQFHEVHKEAKRLLQYYQPDCVVLKIGESNHRGPSAHRVGIEAIIMLACEELHVPVEEKTYQQLRGTNTSALGTQTVLAEAAKYVPPLSTGWDTEIADALVAALRKLGK